MVKEIIIFLLFLVLLTILYKALREPTRNLLGSEKAADAIAFLLALAFSILAIAQIEVLLRTLKTLIILVVILFIIIFTLALVMRFLIR